MIVLGRLSLTLALVFAVASVVFLFMGMRWNRKDLQRNGYYAVYGFFLTTVIATAVLLQAFLKGDFSFGYVAENSDASLSVFYRIAGFWAGQSGSFLLWLLLLADRRHHHRRHRPQPARAAHGRRGRGARHHLRRLRRAHDLRRRLQPVRQGRSRRRAVRPQPAAPAPGHGAAPADAVHRLRRPRGAVRLRRLDAAARPRRQALGAALAEVGRVRLALPLAGHRPRRLVGLRRAQLRRLLGLGRGGEHVARPLAHGDGAAPLVHALQGARPLQALGAGARRRDVLLHHPRHVDDAHRPHQLGARVRTEPRAHLDPLDLPGRDRRRQRRAHHLALARVREPRRGRERALARLPLLRHQPAADAVRRRHRLRDGRRAAAHGRARWGRAPTTPSPVRWAWSSSP